MIDKCPECGNEKIIEVGGMEIAYELSVSTGKYLKKDKHGKSVFWFYKCKCGWNSETYSE